LRFRSQRAPLDVAVYGALTRAGMTAAQAAEQVAAFILSRLKSKTERAAPR
jgi:hypothetical protein